MSDKLYKFNHFTLRYDEHKPKNRIVWYILIGLTIAVWSFYIGARVGKHYGDTEYIIEPDSTTRIIMPVGLKLDTNAQFEN